MNLPVPANSLQIYLSQINQFSILNREEEHSLAVRYDKEKDLEAAHKLVTANLRFVVKVALEYRNYGIKLSDLIQEGNIGLMAAVKKFNPYKGYRLTTYAVWWIRSYIQSFILKSWSLVKRGSRELRKRLFYQLDKTQEAISALDPRCDASGSMQQLLPEKSEFTDGPDLSLDETIGDYNSTTRLDLLPDSSPNQEDIVVENEERQIAKRSLSTALATLNNRERYILENRIMRDAPLSLQMVGDSLGLTRERVRQIEAEALKKLQKRVDR